MKQSVGILAYGSLIANPNEEIHSVTVESKEGVTTPFHVEFARSSGRRRGAPTLVPVTGCGAPVQAHLLVLDMSVADATDRLYRREINKVGSKRCYQYPKNPGPNTVVIKHLEDFHGVNAVLYTEIAVNIENLSAKTLAGLAIRECAGVG